MSTKVVQSDIYPISLSFSRYQNLTFGSALELQQNTATTAYSLGVSSGMTQTAPLQMHENMSNTNAGWFDEGSWVATGVSFTTVIPWTIVSGSSFASSTTAATIADGDVVGIFGPAAWTLGPNMVLTQVGNVAVGVQNATIIIGGGNGSSQETTTTQLFNGFAWQQGPNTNVSTISEAGMGTQNAALVAGGGNNSDFATTYSQTFNGTSWTQLATGIVSARRSVAGGGSQNAAFIAAGINSAGTAEQNTTELFNGASWSTASGNLNISRGDHAACGSQNAGIVVGGTTHDGQASVVSTTELFNGSNWTTNGNMVTAVYLVSGAGTQNAMIVPAGVSAAGGIGITTTQLFNGSIFYVSGGLINDGFTDIRYQHGTAGSQNSSLVVGGQGTLLTPGTEFHNQTVYAKLTYANLREAKNIGIAFGSGTTTGNVVFNGYIGNLSVTTSNTAITAATAAGTFAVLPRYGPNPLNTNMGSVVYTSAPMTEDHVVGFNISLTQMYVHGNSLNSYEHIIRW